jgi:hypothetical protein
VRRSLGLVVGGIGAIGAVLFLRGRRPLAPGADPARELRRRLAQARTGSRPPAPPPPVMEPLRPPEPASRAVEPEPAAEARNAEPDVESRRRQVHERARAAVEAMRGERPREDDS